MTAPGISEDDGLVRAAAAGDREAFGELYVRYARVVHGILLARVPPEEADDLVQDVFLSAMRQLRGLRLAGRHRPQPRHGLFPPGAPAGAARRKA